MANTDIQNLGSFVWSIAEILRGDFKQSEYGKVILPFVVLRRLDCILEDSKDAVLEAAKSLPDGVDEPTRDMILFGAVGGNVKVYNLSRFTFAKLKGQDPGQLHQNLVDYITNFSPNVGDIFLDKFLFTDQLKRLKDGGILWNVFERFSEIDLHPDTISNELCAILGDAASSSGAVFGVVCGDAVGECDAFDDQRQLVCALQTAPCLPRGLNELEDHQLRSLLR